MSTALDLESTLKIEKLISDLRKDFETLKVSHETLKRSVEDIQKDNEELKFEKDFNDDLFEEVFHDLLEHLSLILYEPFEEGDDPDPGLINYLSSEIIEKHPEFESTFRNADANPALSSRVSELIVLKRIADRGYKNSTVKEEYDEKVQSLLKDMKKNDRLQKKNGNA